MSLQGHSVKVVVIVVVAGAVVSAAAAAVAAAVVVVVPATYSHLFCKQGPPGYKYIRSTSI